MIIVFKNELPIGTWDFHRAAYLDPEIGEINDQFMLGSRLVVAPVITKGQKTRTVMLPAGVWQDTAGHIYECVDAAFQVDAPDGLDQVPLFLRLQ